jgi:hypothetical protein
MKIHWHTCRERRFSFGERSPDPDWFEPIGFPPPWLLAFFNAHTRPIASAEGSDVRHLGHPINRLLQDLGRHAWLAGRWRIEASSA